MNVADIITIVAPSYNHEAYIEDCLWSVANQTYEYKELIVIDDFSTDKTPNIIESLVNNELFSKKFSHGIRFIKHKSNRGAHYGINEGLKIAEGSYLTIINTDDKYEINRLEVMMKCITDNKSEIAFSKVDTIDNFGKIMRNEEWEYYSGLQKKVYQWPNINLALLTDNVAISTGNMLFSKSLFKEVGEFGNYKYIHDWDFILRATLLCEPIYVDGTSYLYRLHDTNSFKCLRNDTDLCYKESMDVLLRFCRSIQNKNYRNSKIPGVEVWEYFINHIICNNDIAHIWNCAKNH